MTLSNLSLMMFALLVIAETKRDNKNGVALEDEMPHSDDSEKKHNCPYGSDSDSRVAGTDSFHCHGYAEPGWGTSCPILQAARLKTARAFQIKHHASFLEGVAGYPLSPVFDKTEKIRGDETYEELVKLHITGLMHPEMKTFEDKILLKQKAKRLGIPTTALYFGAHNETWKRTDFTKMLGDLCAQKVDDFMIKATHLVWSKGKKIVKNFQNDYCAQESQSQTQMQNIFIKFIEEEVLNASPNEGDEHLKQLMPGVTVEELFKTGGYSIKPLEAKVQVLWGKVHHIFFFGMDARGCRVNVGSWIIYGDKTGWDLNGIVRPGGKNDPFGDLLLEEAFQTMANYAERFARSLEADFMRVDFFLRAPDQEGGDDWVIEMNECESVSGMQHTFERQGLGEIWRDGYILSRLAMTGPKYQKIRDNTQGARDKWKLDQE